MYITYIRPDVKAWAWYATARLEPPEGNEKKL